VTNGIFIKSSVSAIVWGITQEKTDLAGEKANRNTERKENDPRTDVILFETLHHCCVNSREKLSGHVSAEVQTSKFVVVGNKRAQNERDLRRSCELVITQIWRTN